MSFYITSHVFPAMPAKTMLIRAVMLEENSKTAAHRDLKDNEMLWK